MKYAYLSIMDDDQLFYNDPDAKAVASGDKLAISKKQSELYLQSLFRSASNDLTFIASCDCGNLSGNYYLGSEPIICNKCKSPVRSNFASELKYRAWLEIPESFPPVLQAAVYRVLSKWMGKYQGVPLLDILLDPDEALPPGLEGVIGQGYTYFYKNFDDIIAYLMNSYKPFQMPMVKKRGNNIPLFIKRWRNALFTRHLPVLNDLLHLITQSGTIRYSDSSAKDILDAYIELNNMIYVYKNCPSGHNSIDKYLFSMFKCYNRYCDSIIKDKLVAKEGFIRKNVLGSRCHNTLRAVIGPITDPHLGDEIHLPWRIGVTMLKLEIINILTNRYGISQPDALSRHARALNAYDPFIDEIIQILMKECRYKGFPFLIGRNPTLEHGSIQLHYCTKIKKSIHDNTMGMPPSTINAANADFDGDALYGLAIKEMDMVPELEVLQSRSTLLGADTNCINHQVKLTEQTTIALHEWLQDELYGTYLNGGIR